MEIYDLLEQTLAEVQKGWDEVGYSGEERKKSAAAFADSIKQVCDGMLTHLNEEKKGLEAEEEHTLGLIKRLALQLGDGDVHLVHKLQSLAAS